MIEIVLHAAVLASLLLLSACANIGRHPAPPNESPPTFEGFGTQLTQRSITGQLGGTLDREWLPEGLHVHMILPLDRLAA